MSGVIFYSAGIAFTLGIFIRSLYTLSFPTFYLFLLVSLTCAFVWRLKRGNRRSPLYILSVCLLCFALGLMRVDLSERTHSPLAELVGTSVTLDGVIIREPDVRERSQQLYVRTDEGETILALTDKFQNFAYGDRVEVTGELKVPEPFETDLGRVFDYRGYLRARGVNYMISFGHLTHISNGNGNVFMAALLSGKAIFMQTIEGIIPEPQVGLGEGLLLGVNRALGADLEQIFRRTGIIHIVVLSGYNVMLVAEAIMRLLSFVFRPRTRMVIGVVGISTFALLVGLSATVVRASIMAVLILVARATGRTYAITRALMLAGIAMLLINPYLLVFDPGFQLSFLATVGLIFLAPLIEKRLTLVPTKFQVREFLTATIATQLFVLPILIYSIGSFSIVSVVVNVLVLPTVPITMLLTFITGVFGLLLPSLGILCGYVAHLALSYIIVVATFFGSMSFAAIAIPAIPFWVVLVAYGGMGLTLFHFHTQKNIFYGNEYNNTDNLSDWTIEEEVDQVRQGLPFR